MVTFYLNQLFPYCDYFWWVVWVVILHYWVVWAQYITLAPHGGRDWDYRFSYINETTNLLLLTTGFLLQKKECAWSTDVTLHIPSMATMYDLQNGCCQLRENNLFKCSWRTLRTLRFLFRKHFLWKGFCILKGWP